MEFCRIEDVKVDGIDSLINLCVPPAKRSDKLFVEGIKAKKEWAIESLKKFGSIAKIAYLDSRPAGLIQYQPKPKERLIEMTCIFVPNKQDQRRGIGKALLRRLIEDANKPREFFNNEPALALVTWAFNVPGYYPQNEFYLKMGFKKVWEDDPFLLYYPLKNGYVYRPKEEGYNPQEEDRGKALIFYDPSCPFCIYFAEQIKRAIREVASDIPIRMINMFREREEIEKRGQVPYCAVNCKPIRAFFMDKERFQKEVKEAIGEA